jgi:hypothetical protein
MPDLNNFKAYNDAKSIYSEMLFIAADSSAGTISNDRSEDVLILEYASNNPQKISFDQVFSSIVEIMEKTIPYLSTSEMKDIYAVIEMKAAPLNLIDDDKKWMDFFKALCSYDMVALRKSSLELLPDNSDIEGSYFDQILLSSLFIAAYKTGDSTGIGSFWDRYYSKNNPDVMTRFTYSLAARAF